MKRILLTLIVILMSVGLSVYAADDRNGISWQSTTHDFGHINASDGKVKAEYTFVNNSSEAVAVISVTNGGCGCTVPKFPRKPIASGAKGTVTITFDPARFKGEFKRQVTVTLMVGGKRVKSKLKFSGYIIPKE